MRNLLFLIAVLAAAQTAARKSGPPLQPIAYSHKKHIENGLKCKDCHTMPDPGEMMTIPAVSRCMSCHQAIKQDSPEIQKLAEFARRNRPVPWQRVYQIPSYVFFSHKAHLESAAGVTCETCHGPVAQREALFKETDISMGGCMDCHRKNRVSNDCTFCHDQRN